MTIRLNLKTAVILVVVAALLGGGIAYAAVSAISRSVEGFVRVTAEVSVDEVLILYEDDDGRPGDPLERVDFGTVGTDPFGNLTDAATVTVWVENGGGTKYVLSVDDSDPIDESDTLTIGEVLMLEPVKQTADEPAPQIPLDPGDIVPVKLGLDITHPAEGDHTFTVRFRAKDVQRSLLYDIDFGTPPHHIGSRPATGRGLEPRETVSRVKFGTPTVVSALGALDDQPLMFDSTDGAGDQIALDFDDLSGGQRYEMTAEILVHSGDRTGRFRVFSVLFDAPLIRNIEFYSDGTYRGIGARHLRRAYRRFHLRTSGRCESYTRL